MALVFAISLDNVFGKILKMFSIFEDPDCDSNILLDDNSEMVTLATQPNLTVKSSRL